MIDLRVAVVGAGILGASTAYHLARLGAAVTIFDRDDAGRATAAGAGIVSPWVSANEDPAYYAISAAGARYYPALVADLRADGESDLGYRQVGSLVVPEDATQLDRVEATLAHRRAHAPEVGAVRRLSPNQAAALFPPLSKTRAALHIEGSARIDGRRLAAGLLRAARSHGATLGGAVSQVIVSTGCARGVMTEQGAVHTDLVIVTTGAWAPALLAPLGVTLDVQPQRGQIVHLRTAAATDDWPVLQPLNGYYLLAFDGSRVVIGATRETGSGFDYRVTAAGQAEVLKVGLAVAPGLADAELIETRIGFRPMAPDDRPILGHTDVAGLLVGNGLGHSGLTIGPYAGRLLADLALGRPPELDLAPYGPARR